jgi:hypothetical protein
MIISAACANVFGFLTTKFTKDTKGLDHKTPNFVLFVSFVVQTILSSLVAAPLHWISCG